MKCEKWKNYRFDQISRNCDKMRIPLSSAQRAKKQGIYSYYGAQGVIDHIDDYIFDGTYMLIAEDGENLKSKKQNIAQLANGQFWVNNHAHIVSNNQLSDIRFLCFKFNSTDVSGYITGSAQPKLSQTNLNSIIFDMPPLPEQKAIADTLSCLDDKIELNNRMNRTLEEMAQAIFKSWFVDFEPFQDGEFVDSELGKIPKGWRIGRADDFFNICIGKTPPRKEPQWFSKCADNVRWVSISDMGNSGMFISKTSELLTRSAIAKFNVNVAPDNTVLLSFKLTIGRVAITDGEMATNEAIAHFKPTNEWEVEYIYWLLKLYNYASLGSTSSIATAVNSKMIKAMKVYMPDEKTIKNFHTLLFPLMNKIKYNLRENTKLEDVRDSLLPKLMSGEIRVPMEAK